MSSSSKQGTRKTVLATIGILLIPAACCGALPLLGVGLVSAAGVVGVVGSVLGNPWVIAAAVVLAAGFIWWVLRRRSAAKRQAESFTVAEPASVQGHADRMDGLQR
ncbi:hypothetical protein [Rhodoglobus aureus]|uniref:MerT n=1 Tax=Rhodoglobus aureus TaxID=191497 RepID=A0ABN1VX67_9MICO